MGISFALLHYYRLVELYLAIMSHDLRQSTQERLTESALVFDVQSIHHDNAMTEMIHPSVGQRAAMSIARPSVALSTVEGKTGGSFYRPLGAKLLSPAEFKCSARRRPPSRAWEGPGTTNQTNNSRTLE